MQNDRELTALGDRYREVAQTHHAGARAEAKEADRKYRENTANCYQALANIADEVARHVTALRTRAASLKADARVVQRRVT